MALTLLALFDKMHASVIVFVRKILMPSEVVGRDVLEVGSYNVNGSVRSVVSPMRPGSYVGIDIRQGPGVDVVCEASSVSDRFGENVFDLVLSTEMLEHALDWKGSIAAIKKTLKANGILLLTARGHGFPLHEFPGDHWRFSVDDMRLIFSDFAIEVLQNDPQAPGVFLRARKPVQWTPVDLSAIEVEQVS